MFIFGLMSPHALCKYFISKLIIFVVRKCCLTDQTNPFECSKYCIHFRTYHGNAFVLIIVMAATI